jgi:hypothetical protein
MADFAPQGIYVNGFLYGKSSSEIDVDGKKFRAVNAINYKRMIAREDVRGTGALPVGQTKGEATHEADLELALHEGFLFLTYLAQKARERGAAGPSCVPFNIGVSWDEPGGAGTNTVEINNATYKGDDTAVGQGAAGIVMKLTLHVSTAILYNGEPIIYETNSALADVGNVVLAISGSVGG